MKTYPISSNTAFSGNVILKNRLSVNQNYLFNLHKQNLEKMIKDMPFDLFAEQSKSRKTIQISINVEGANVYFVRKNEQDFEKAAGLAIEDAKKKSELYQTMVKVNELLGFRQNVFANVITGNFKEARKSEKQLAKYAIKNFEYYKKMPKINFTNVPLEIQKTAIFNSIKYRFYKIFQIKTPEEKTFLKMLKEYRRELKRENKQVQTVNIQFPNF